MRRSAGYFALGSFFLGVLTSIGSGVAITPEHAAMPAQDAQAESPAHWTRLESPVPNTLRLTWAESEMQTMLNPAPRPALMASRVATLIEQVAVSRASENPTDLADLSTLACSGDSCSVEQPGNGPQVLIRENGRVYYQVSRIQNPERLVLDFPGTNLGTSIRKIPSHLPPVRGVRLGQFTPQTARVVVDLDEGAQNRFVSQANSLTIFFDSEQNAETFPFAAAQGGALKTPQAAPGIPASKGVAAAPAPVAQAPAAPRFASLQMGAKYTGEPISVNLKDVDLKDFFRLIHEISGLNVVLDPNVKGTLTLVLTDVPWDQALDIVLRDNSLDRQLEGDVLRIATKETLKKEAVESRDLAKAQIEAADVVTTTRTLSYAKAVDVRETLKRFLSSRGEVLADLHSNTLIIRDVPTVLPVLDKLIQQLDRKSQQVEIEARVVLATREFAREIGTQFGVLGSGGSTQNVVGGVPGVGTSPVTRTNPLPSPASPTGQIPLNTNLPPTAPTSGILFAHTEGNLALDFALSAAESKGQGRLISKPKIITQNNETATVKQGTKIPVQTIINNTISVQFIDAVLKLQVTPQITADGNVFMDVLVENTQIDPAIQRIDNIPALDTQAAETKVLIHDGGTVVIGGIIISSQRMDISQVPLFGSIPVIGNLFKHSAVSNQSQELLFFLTPRVLPTT